MNRQDIERLPRFGVVDGVITPHAKGTMVRLDDVLSLATPDRADPERRADGLDILMRTGGWTLTIEERSSGGYYEPEEQWVTAEWSSPGVKPIRVNEPTVEDALRSIRAVLSAPASATPERETTDE